MEYLISIDRARELAQLYAEGKILPIGDLRSLLAWVRAWLLRLRQRSGPNTLDRVDAASILGRELGMASGDGVRIVPALRLAKQAGWPE